jgi:hypothetical protein
MREFLANVLHYLGQAYWVEVKTDHPPCTYYFGPFLSVQEADTEKEGYCEDLELEGAKGIQVEVKRCRPTQLTITDDWGEWNGYGLTPDLED